MKWDEYVSAATDDFCVSLANGRGITSRMFLHLRNLDLLGAYQGGPAFPVVNSAGTIIGEHHRSPFGEGGRSVWRYFWFGEEQGITPLVLGNPETAAQVWVFESQWDAIAALAIHRWHISSAVSQSIAAVITRGAQNGAKIRGSIPAGKRIFAFPQNDPVTKPGKPTAAETWLGSIIQHAGSPVLVVETPPEFKDVNDWIKAGAELPELHGAICAALPARIGPLSASPTASEEDPGDESAGPFPTEALPAPFCDLIRGVARVVQVPEALPAMVMLAAISTAVGKGLRAQLLPGKISGANIYLLAVARSGIGKSSAAAPILAPLHDMQESRLAQWQRETWPGLDAQKEFLVADVKRLAKSPNKSIGDEPRKRLQAELAKKKAELQEVEDALKATPRLICEDVTSQELAIIMQKNDETTALISTDAGEVVNNLLGRYSKLDRADDSLAVKAFSGDRCLVDRVGRPPVNLKSPCMTMLLMIQPDKLASLMQSPQLLEGGFLPRCLIAKIGVKLAHLKPGVREIDRAIRSAYTNELSNLLTAFRLGKERHLIDATPEALQIMLDYVNEIIDDREMAMLRTDSFLARWAEQACRLSVVLHAAKWGSQAATQVLDVDTAWGGVALARWFGRQQLQVLNSADAETRAQVLTGIQNLAHQQPEGFTAREVYRANICDSAEDAERYLRGFVAKGVLSETKRQTGGRPTVVYQFAGGNQ